MRGRSGAALPRVCRCGARVPAARSGAAALSGCARDDERVPVCAGGPAVCARPPVCPCVSVGVRVSPGRELPPGFLGREASSVEEKVRVPHREKFSSAPVCLHSPSAQGSLLHGHPGKFLVLGREQGNDV
ncbi:uncharacterized protein ACIQIH_007398 [Cyanocitta cristata]